MVSESATELLDAAHSGAAMATWRISQTVGETRDESLSDTEVDWMMERATQELERTLRLLMRARAEVAGAL